MNFVLLRDVTIPAGTVLSRAVRSRGGDFAVECPVAVGADAFGWFVMPADATTDAEGWVAETPP